MNKTVETIANLEYKEGKISGLFYYFVKALKENKPNYFIFENVKGCLSSNNGWDFAVMQIEFKEAGYDIQWQVLNSKNFGLAQNRKETNSEKD